MFDTKARVLLSGNVTTQARCKSITAKPKVIIQNKYKRQDLDIGLYGYSLLASNATNRFDDL